MRSRHGVKASSYEDIAEDCEKSITTNASQRAQLEKINKTITTAHDRLATAIAACSGVENQSDKLISRSKLLVDQYNAITVRTSDVVNALELLQTSNTSLSWDSLRYRALQSIVELITYVQRYNVLDTSDQALTPEMGILAADANQVLKQVESCAPNGQGGLLLGDL